MKISAELKTDSDIQQESEEEVKVKIPAPLKISTPTRTPQSVWPGVAMDTKPFQEKEMSDAPVESDLDEDWGSAGRYRKWSFGEGGGGYGLNYLHPVF